MDQNKSIIHSSPLAKEYMNDVLNTVPLWFTLPELKGEYCQDDVVARIASTLGSPLSGHFLFHGENTEAHPTLSSLCEKCDGFGHCSWECVVRTRKEPMLVRQISYKVMPAQLRHRQTSGNRRRRKYSRPRHITRWGRRSRTKVSVIPEKEIPLDEVEGLLEVLDTLDQESKRQNRKKKKRKVSTADDDESQKEGSAIVGKELH